MGDEFEKISDTHIGSTLDDFLKKDGIFDDARTRAMKERAARQRAEVMHPLACCRAQVL